MNTEEAAWNFVQANAAYYNARGELEEAQRESHDLLDRDFARVEALRVEKERCAMMLETVVLEEREEKDKADKKRAERAAYLAERDHAEGEDVTIKFGRVFPEHDTSRDVGAIAIGIERARLALVGACGRPCGDARGAEITRSCGRAKGHAGPCAQYV